MPRPFIPVEDTLEAELTFRVSSTYMTNRLYFFRAFPTYAPGDDLLLASWLGTWVINFYLPALANDVLFIHSRARFCTSASDPWATIPYTGYFGTYPDVAMPANCTFRVRSRRQVYDSKQRPYICVPAPPRSAVVENEFTEDYWAIVRDALTEVYEPLSPFGAEWVWVSFQHNNAWRSAGRVRYWGILEPVYTVSPRRRRLRNTALYPP